MKSPVATYRVQLNRDFDFVDLKKLIPYFHQLGISHIYVSPVFKSKQGSMHGYDVVDPNVISEELGGRAAFESLSKELSVYSLDWIQDIVPNHVSYSLENKMICDLMQKGPASEYIRFFDVDWNYPSERLNGKILAPFLTESYFKCLKQRLISLTKQDVFNITYNGMNFPVNLQVTQNWERYNSNAELLDKVISNQFYSLSYWKTALKKINYRRFFDIIDLIGVKIEDPAVFESFHRLVFSLVRSCQFSGLRIDHIDGLYNPEEYLTNLRSKLPDAYLIVEKILADEEQLPTSWPVQGTTGYDFLNYTNKVFIQGNSESEIDAFYQHFTSNMQVFSELLYDCKKLVIQNFFWGDVRNIARLISHVLNRNDFPKKIVLNRLMQAVAELLACFQVYRTYTNKLHADYEAFTSALTLAKQKNADLTEELAAIDYLFARSTNSPKALHVIMRIQQFTGAIMAKGFEDTAFYRYNRFISLNEVGGNPAKFSFSAKEFHNFNSLRQQKWPLSLNATSTHDTKRGEDIRARLNVLSEIPNDFIANVKLWSKLNECNKQIVNGKLAPDKSEEYYLYQVLLGAYPLLKNKKQEFADRLKVHIIKALREAKKNSDWLAPKLRYELAVSAFVAALFGNESFQGSFLPLQEKIAFYGLFNTLAQTLLKVTCPGVPDFYQGTELWDLNLVDPDNRRLVNFENRQKLLSEISKMEPSKVPGLLKGYRDGRAKLYVIYKALEIRSKMKTLFTDGAYIPLNVEGARSKNVICFARQKRDASAITVVPRFLTGLIEPHTIWGKIDIWGDTRILLPDNASSVWVDAFTGRKIHSISGQLSVSSVLSAFPVALLCAGDLIE